MWLELHMIATSKRNYEFKTTYDYDFNSLLMFGITHIRDLTHEHWKKGRRFDNFVVNGGGTISCHSDNLQCHQWRQSCQFDGLLFSVESVHRAAFSSHLL